jgi:hypothetical protein
MISSITGIGHGDRQGLAHLGDGHDLIVLGHLFGDELQDFGVDLVTGQRDGREPQAFA